MFNRLHHRLHQLTDHLVERPGCLLGLAVAMLPFLPLWLLGAAVFRSAHHTRARAAARQAQGRVRCEGAQLRGPAGPVDWAQVREAQWFSVDRASAFAADEGELLLRLTAHSGQVTVYWVDGIPDPSWPGLPAMEGGRLSTGLPEAFALLVAFAWAVVLYTIWGGG